MEILTSIYSQFIQETIRVFATGKVNVAKANKFIYFPRNADLLNLKVVGIKAVCFDDSPKQIVNGSVVDCLSLDVHSKYNITLIADGADPNDRSQDRYIIKDYPLAALTTRIRRGRMFETNNLSINLGKSYIQPKIDMTTDPGTFILQFYYE